MSEWVSLTSGEIDLIAQYPEVWNEVYDEECGCYNEELDEDKFARRIESALRHKNKKSQVPVKGHNWDDAGERYLVCGDKDWFAGPICIVPPPIPYAYAHEDENRQDVISAYVKDFISKSESIDSGGEHHD